MLNFERELKTYFKSWLLTNIDEELYLFYSYIHQ